MNQLNTDLGYAQMVTPEMEQQARLYIAAAAKDVPDALLLMEMLGLLGKEGNQ